MNTMQNIIAGAVLIILALAIATYTVLNGISAWSLYGFVVFVLMAFGTKIFFTHLAKHLDSKRGE